MAFISPLWQAGLSQVLLRSHQEDIQDCICILSFFLIKVTSARSFSLLVQVKHSSNWDKVSRSSYCDELELEANIANSAPAAVTEIPLSSVLSMTSEPGLSNSTQHPQSTCYKCMVLRGKSLTLQDISASSCLDQNWTHRDSKSQSEQCYRTEFAFPSCSDWSTAEGRDYLNSKLKAISCFAWHFRGRSLTDNFQDTNILVTIAAKGGTHMYLYIAFPSPPSSKVPIVLRCVCLLDSVMLLLKGKSVDICYVTWSIIIPCNVITNVNPPGGFILHSACNFFLDGQNSY